MNGYGNNLDKNDLAHRISKISYPSFLTQNQKSKIFIKETNQENIFRWMAVAES